MEIVDVKHNGVHLNERGKRALVQHARTPHANIEEKYSLADIERKCVSHFTGGITRHPLNILRRIVSDPLVYNRAVYRKLAAF